MSRNTNRTAAGRRIAGRAIILLGILAAVLAACGPGTGAAGY